MSTTDAKISAPAEAPTTASPAATDSAPAAVTAAAAPTTTATPPTTSTPPKISLDTSSRNSEPAIDFAGDVDTNNALPTQATLSKIEDYPVLDRDGKSVPFKSLYTGPNVPRRVLLIFVRHFYCGNCQQYLKTLSASITPDALLQLPVPTFIAVIGCGSPSLIKMYADATACPFPIYSDPTAKLYSDLGMVRTLALGARPEYQRRGLVTSTLASIVQGLKQIPAGRALVGGDMQQVGGEFLFEPVGELAASPITPGVGEEEDKRVVWCHRMRNTRDHAEVPELREVLGLDGLGVPGGNAKRWMKAVSERKGTGLSTMSSLNDESGVLVGEPKRAVEGQ
ncbi:hypothetical protein V494_03851 [Pseudogymnoascus sp. VKM F-4513 (FW-928)]|nr:hypothetical protein V494_03851 [Pseudogymnoascus sp. VKM F-4513 (FW-928)]